MPQSTITDDPSSNKERILKKKEIKSLNLFTEEFSNKFEQRLIDTDFFYKKGSEIGNSERYNRGKTIHTINVWWARRPLSTMRALIYASLLTDFTDHTLDLFDNLSASILLPESIYKEIRTIVRKYASAPKILDPFGGNGTIAFEATNLGLSAYSMDINEYAFFIQKSLLNYGFSCSEDSTNKLLEKHGTHIIEKLRVATEDLFPQRSKNFTNYLWTYQTTCKNCRSVYSLSKRKYVSKKKHHNIEKLPIGIQYNYNSNEEEFIIATVTDREHFKKNNWKKNNSICPLCNHENNIDFKETKDVLTIGIRIKDTFGKEFSKNDGKLLPASDLLNARIQSFVEKYNLVLPSSLIEKWSGIVNPAIYGMESHLDIFNLRQKAVIIILIGLILDEYELITSEQTQEVAKYVISILTGFLDQLIDWNCRLSMWISENEQVGRAFCGPGIPMLWDYSEIDPVLHGPANLWDKLDRLIKSKKSFIKESIKPTIVNAQAQNLPFDNKFFDLVITDPPYYDNIYYSVLSNFFYTWKKVLMEKIEPELFSKPITTFTGELVSSKYRNIDPQIAHEIYCTDFKKAVLEIERVCKDRGLFSLIYGHSTIEGWLPILEAFKDSSFYITSVQPLRIERLHRPRSMKSNASNSVVVLVARKFSQAKTVLKLQKYISQVTIICQTYIPSLQKDLWSTFEIGIPVYANCICLIANHSSILDDNNKIVDIQSLISLIISQIQNFLPDFSIKSRKSL